MPTYLSRLRSHPSDTTSLYPRELTELDGTIYFTKSDGTVVTVNPKNVDSAAKLTTSKSISLTGAVTGTATTDFSTNVSINTTIDASKITSGTLPLSVIPKGALERLVPVTDKSARLSLTISDVQNGDVVKENDTKLMYFVVDETKLGTEDAFTVFSAGTAASVPWTGISDKPEFATVATSGEYDDLINKPTIYSPSDDNPTSIGTTSPGTSSTFARSDHVHAHNTVAVETDQTSTASPSAGSTFTAIDSVTRDGNGHVTKVNTKTVTIPTHMSVTKTTDSTTSSGTLAPGSTYSAIDSVIRDTYGHTTKVNTKSFTLASDLPYYGIGYGTCSTAAETAEKTVSIANFKRRTGSIVTVVFKNGNTNSQMTMNVNSTGAATVVCASNLRPAVGTIKAKDVVTFTFDGTYWVITSIDEQVSRYTLSVTTDSWSTTVGGGSTSYSKSFTVTGMTSTDYPIVDLVTPESPGSAKTAIENYSNIYRISTSTDSVSIYSWKVPTESFTIQLINPKLMHS